MAAPFADKVSMQHRLFGELSRMFGAEVPVYDKSLLVNRECNRAVCGLLGQLHRGFLISPADLDRTSGERHGAIRIGREDEYRWVCRFFAQFAMEPVNFYDMASVGAKSQPIVATAFRSVVNPDHRVFTSLLLTESFDAATRARIEAVLSKRQVFSDRARSLIEKGERQGGLEQSDAEALIREGTDRIFKWTGRARDHALYTHLCDTGLKIAADIACFESHHLNHLTPNTLCMDLYTTAMKFCLGEMDAAAFTGRAAGVLGRLLTQADRQWMRLHFKQMDRAVIDGFGPGGVAADEVQRVAEALAARLSQPDLQLSKLKHAGFKDFTEGPSFDTPVFLRQDAYKALTEPVVFTNSDGTTVNAVHTARFGEIEERFYACTPKGRALYDKCLAAADAQRDAEPGVARRDPAAYEANYASHFAAFAKTVRGLLEARLIYGRYWATPKGVAARGTLTTTDLGALVESGHADVEGLRYEDFLPVSAAGIFASNLNQYGTKTHVGTGAAAAGPAHDKARLEGILGRAIVDADAVYRGLWAESVLETYRNLGVLDRVPKTERVEIETAASRSAAATLGSPRHAAATPPLVAR